MDRKSVLSRLGIISLPHSARLLIDIAQEAERLGFYGIGVVDSPMLYGEMYPIIAAMLANTSSIRIGTNVTNPVSRHWTVHASSARTFTEMGPGRFFLGMGVGDGAVHSVGLKPATRAELVDATRNIRERVDASVDIHLAVSGPKMARAAGEVADGIILSTGTDSVALNGLSSIIQSAAGRRLPIWPTMYVDTVDADNDLSAAKERSLPIAVAQGRFCFSETFEGKNVPPELQSVLRERLSHYDFMHHAKMGGNANATMFDDLPEVQDYLRDRFCVVGSGAQCLERFATLMDSADLEGIWLVVNSSDPIRIMQSLADAAR